jgi:hypothetical protein
LWKIRLEYLIRIWLALFGYKSTFGITDSDTAIIIEYLRGMEKTKSIGKTILVAKEFAGLDHIAKCSLYKGVFY